MLDNVLIIMIFLFITLSFFIVKVWKKKHFAKELYISEGASIAFFVIIISTTIGLLITYFVNSKEFPYSWLYLLIVLLYDLLLLFVFCLIATTCIFLKGETLVKKNIIITKQILLNRETKIIEKIDKKIVKSNEKSSSISSRYLTGDINNLMNNVKIIINK